MPMEPVQGFDPNAGEYHEQKDGFLILANRSSAGGITILGCCPTLKEAENIARTQVKDGQADNAFVVPAPMACGIRRNWSHR